MSIKSLAFLPILTLSLHAAETLPETLSETKREYIRVEEDDKAARLQTSIVTMEKDGKRVDLIGAIHIADKAYYSKLNERFSQYDRLLFEMVGGENYCKGKMTMRPKQPTLKQKSKKEKSLTTSRD